MGSLCFFLLTSFQLIAQDSDSFFVSRVDCDTEIVISELEPAVVSAALTLFKEDVYRITNRRLVSEDNSQSKYQIRVGTLGVDEPFDQECKKAGIDICALKDEWETYVIKSVPAENDGAHVLYVVGSQPRGTAYGLMHLSRLIGVSPWEWWADVNPEKRESIELPADLYITEGPKVKFRGIFLNDEDWGLQPWAAKTFEPETGDIGPKTYEKIFELLLRLKANAIWPAMHDCTRAFFTYPDNIKMADKYGIWVGSSHCEPMLRNNVDEWYKWNPSDGQRGKWNFDENPEKVKEYWEERVKESSNYDGIYTVGMRGIHDGDMPGGKNVQDKVEILTHVFDAQRNILETITGNKVTNIPQIFCPYKEVLEIYRAGAEVPDDVTIMWADDNNGYIRQLSNTNERQRFGGAGVYYHISYWGRPHDYLWLESTPVSLIWEEMNKAYQTNAKDIWIVNVGDIKPIETGMNFFLEMAWNPDQFSPENLSSYYKRFAKEQFGEDYAEEIGAILTKYFELNFARKPEHMGWNSIYPNTPIQDPKFSLYTNGDEVQQRIDAYQALEDQVADFEQRIPERLKDAFYQLVAYKVYGASNMNKKILYAYKSREYAQQGRVSANMYAEKSKEALEQIQKITNRYNEQNGGKWMHMMTYNPRDLPVFGMPELGQVEPLESTSGGVMVEGSSSPLEPGSKDISLPVFLSSTDKRYFIDVFNTGLEPLKWSTTVKDECIQISSSKGKTSADERIWVSIDWSKMKQNTRSSLIELNVGGSKYFVEVKAQLNQIQEDDRVFVEDNGVIAFEAEHFNEIQNTTKTEWKTIQGLGRQNDVIGTFPITATPLESSDKASSVSYDFYSASTGEATLRFYCLPSQPINEDYQLRVAVSIDGRDPTIIDASLKEVMNENNEEWRANVLRATNITETKVMIPQEGKHQLTITMIDPGVVLDKIEVQFGEGINSYFGSKESQINTN